MDNPSPLVSIITPVFNREQSIKRSALGVLNQTFTDWEWIIIDDCSTDNTFEVVQAFNDSRILALRMPSNKGAAAARNVGIFKARGEFISFLDSDDSYEADFIRSSVELLRIKKEVGFIWTGYRLKFLNHSIEKNWTPDKHQNPYNVFLRELKIGIGAGVTIRRIVFEKIGVFDESLPAAEDSDLFLRISKAFSYDYIEEPLINIYRSSSDRLSKDYSKNAIAYNILIGKHLQNINDSKQLRYKYFYKAMWLNYHLGNKSLSRYYFFELMRDSFFYFKPLLILMLFETTGKYFGSKIHIRLTSFFKSGL